MEYDVSILFVIGFFIWLAYKFGVVTGREKERKSERLYAQAEAETDPIKRQELLLAWNELVEDSHLRRVFRESLLSQGKKGQKPPTG